MLASKFGTLFDYEGLPLLEQAGVDVREEEGHKGIFLVHLLVHLTYMKVIFKLLRAREVLLENDRGDELGGLTEQKVALLGMACPRFTLLRQEALQEMSEVLEESKLFGFRRRPEALFIQ